MRALQNTRSLTMSADLTWAKESHQRALLGCAKRGSLPSSFSGFFSLAMALTHFGGERMRRVERLRTGEEQRYEKRWSKKVELIGQILRWSPDGAVRHVRA